jgi:hypothetical protein
VPSCVKFESLATPVKYQLTYIGQICETRFAGFFVVEGGLRYVRVVDENA